MLIGKWNSLQRSFNLLPVNQSIEYRTETLNPCSDVEVDEAIHTWLGSS